MSSPSAPYNEVTRTNIEPLFGDIRAVISKAKFIAIDTEFTGLVIGNASPVFKLDYSKWTTRATDMRQKYEALANVAKTHALVSMGVSAYSVRHASQPNRSYNINNFNFLLQSQNSHLVNPSSMYFLADNGFDLAKQATQGIRYFSGPNPLPPPMKNEAVNREGLLVREVFLDIVRSQVPLVIHNGLFDLVYLYQSFFGPLPDTYESFAFDLYNMFPAGIFDTKYMAEMTGPGTASYLGYLFHKNERIQKRLYEQGVESLEAKLRDRIPYEAPKRKTMVVQKTDEEEQKPYCEHFALYGHCKLKDICFRSHDINFILDCQEQEEAATNDEPGGNAKRKRDDGENDTSNKRSKASAENDTLPSEPTEPTEPADPVTTSESMYHTAAYDAFMTGYIFACYRLSQDERQIDEFKNKAYLMGKPDQPLLIKESSFSGPSGTYRQTLRIINEPKI